jgi:hypothetical protein
MRERQKQDDKNSCSKWYHSSQSFRAPRIKTHTAWKKLGRISPEDPPRDQSIYQFFCPQNQTRQEEEEEEEEEENPQARGFFKT